MLVALLKTENTEEKTKQFCFGKCFEYNLLLEKRINMKRTFIYSFSL